MKKITFKFIIAAFLLLISNISLFAQSVNLTASPNQGCAPLAVSFNVSGNQPTGTYRVVWDFNDGSPAFLDTVPLLTTVTHTFANPGYYNVWITAFDNAGNNLGTVYCNNNIQVDGISISSSDSACINDLTSFCANGDQVNSVSWSFSDGFTSNQQCVDHAFTTTGTKTITLTASSSCGTQIVTKTIVVSTTAQPYPYMWANSNSTCSGAPVSFYTGTYASYFWYFGDGTTSNLQYPEHAFTTTGNYTVILTVTNGCGMSGSAPTQTISIINNPPFPNQSWFNLNNSSPVCPGSNVSFNAPGGYNSYQWNFGDNSAVVTTTDSWANHTYGNTLGNYTATVKIFSACGTDTTMSSIVYITNNAPWPNDPQWFTMQNSSPVCPNSNVSFNAPGGYNTYQWNFGDNSPVVTTTENYSNHTYGNTYTNYTATVTITNSCGNDTTLYSVVHVTNNAPWPNNQNFTLENAPFSCPNSNVSFNAPWGYSNYQWNFGDDSTIVTTTNNYNHHTYGSSLSQYTVSVKVTNNCGSDTTLYSTVNISNTAPWPNQSFGLYVNSPSCPNSNVGFNAPEGYSNYQWSFGDNSPLITTNTNWANHFYGNVTGTYSVSVKITSACGNDTILYSTLVINNTAPFPNQSWFKLESPNSACPNDDVNFNAPDGYPHYEWNFGDGFPVAVTTQNYSHHSYGNTNGTYTASVKITNGCGQDTILYTTIQVLNTGGFSNQWFELYTTSPVCPNSNVGFGAPDGYSSYVWDFGDNSPLTTSSSNNYGHTYLGTAQTYTVSVKITNGCGNDTTLFATVQIQNNVGFPNDQWFKIEGGPNPACPGDQVNANAPWGYSDYFWKFGDGDSISSSQNYAHHVYTTAGTYTYSVKITNACGNDTTLFGTIVVGSNGAFYSGLSIEIDQNTSCPNDLIHFRLNQNGFNAYHWNFGDGDSVTTNGEDIQHAFDTLGLYTVSCKVSNGCGNTTTVYATIQVTSNSPVSGDLAVMGIQNPSCPGDNVFFVLNDIQATTTYIWNYGDGSPADTTVGTGSNHVYSSIGTNVVTVTAINTCGMSKTVTMTQIVSSGPTPSLIGQDGGKTWGYPGGENNNNGTVGCAGDAIIFYFMGSAANNVWDFGDGNTGTATEEMLVSGGDGGVFPVTIIKHVYTNNGSYVVHLTITNNCGNSVTDSIAINVGGNQPVNGELTTSPPPYTTCAPIDFLAFGGSTYAWNFGDGATLTSSSPTASHTFATQGVYVVTVLVTNGCGNTATYSKSVNVNGAGGPAITIVSSTSPTCVGGNNGSAIIAVASGQTPYTYSWTNPNGQLNTQTTDSVTNLTPGIHYVKVTDNIGCASIFAVNINNAVPIILAGSSTASSCTSATGSASVSVTSGGNGPFTYSWSNGSTTSSISNLAYGLYSATVTDLNGCHATANVNVSQTNAPTITLNTVTDVTCYGSNDGAININVAGGTSYTYLWSTGATTQDIDSLVAGTYNVQVTSNTGCSGVFNATVAEAAILQVVTATEAAPTCGNFDGEASATVTGGTSPYTYLWDANANNQTTATATGLPAGTYTVTVTDAHGCTEDSEVSLSNSNAPDIAAVVTDISCNGNADGSIDITVTGGTSPYLYTWNVGSPQTNHQDLNTLGAGNYLIFVNDAQGCMSVRSYTIVEPEQLGVTVTNTGATCNIADGTAMATVEGGTTPYTYSWTGGQTSQDADSLAVGSYTVTITDNKGCIATATTTVATSAPTPSICMVTVDEASVNNIIYWDKTTYTNVDSFIVYREVSTNLYKRIGAVLYDSLSMFADTTRSVGPANGNPNAGTYRYKLQLLDACGNYSAMSPYHNTIYVVDNGQGQFTWNSYDVEGVSSSLANNYILICDTANLNSWFAVATVAGTQTVAVDPDFATHNLDSAAVWRVKTDWSITCDPSRAPIVTSRSNKKHATPTGISTLSFADMGMKVYPNPAKDNLTVELAPLDKNARLKIVNMLSQTVYNEVINASSVKTIKQVNTGNYSKGVYYVILETTGKTTMKKLVID